ncbi:MAG: RNA pseudouridine synthase, partial [Bdellovibrionales bacterium]|nr:RNA pseudouridine synthase [Bdellovibrionales bacterium]
MKIVFENPHFLAADKAPGWLSVPSRLGADDARPCVGRELEKTHGRVWPVHRLDLEVSGLILFARNAEAHRAA